MPQDTWHIWSAQKRTWMVRGEDRGKKAWHVVLLVDKNENMLNFLDKFQSGRVKTTDYDEILQSGRGEDMPKEVWQSVLQRYPLYRKDNSTG